MVVASTILAIVVAFVYQLLTNTVRGQDKVRDGLKSPKVQNAILSQIIRDFRYAYYVDFAGNGGFNGMNRNVGGNGRGGAGDGIECLPVGRATSAIASIGGGERPLASGGPGPSRTDEEIQIVFDRYKASFYRLYNRELRNDPTLQGQMVLRLTIEPDGSVSMCALVRSDMEAPELATEVVSRVKTINFGAKEGVQALTIVYPIDFLPAE